MKLNGKEKETADAGLKRSRSSSLAAATGPQRVPLGPGRVGDGPVQTNNSRPTSRTLKPTQLPSRPSRPLSQHTAPPIIITLEEDDVEQLGMGVEEARISSTHMANKNLLVGEDEVEGMIGVTDSEADEEEEEEEDAARLMASNGDVVYAWPDVSPGHAARYQMEVDQIRATFEEDVEGQIDETMVSSLVLLQACSPIEAGLLIPSPRLPVSQSPASCLAFERESPDALAGPHLVALCVCVASCGQPRQRAARLIC